jgi:deazaflavin-dependent oxidoreductase (nitroreductase family)
MLMSVESMDSERLRLALWYLNRLMILLWRLGLGGWGNGTAFTGWVMVLGHTGRKSGRRRLTPVNYAIIDGDIYCTAGFGARSDWYRNICNNPLVEIWLPRGRWAGMAEDLSNAPDRLEKLRRVIIASGFAGPLFGVNASRLDDQELDAATKAYRLIRIRRYEALTGPDGPGDLAWIWPLATFGLLALLLRIRRRKSQ